MAANADFPRWRRSSRCDSTTCVEVATEHDRIRVRSSSEPDGPILEFTVPEWINFIAGLRQGDDPE